VAQKKRSGNMAITKNTSLKQGQNSEEMSFDLLLSVTESYATDCNYVDCCAGWNSSKCLLFVSCGNRTCVEYGHRLHIQSLAQ